MKLLGLECAPIKIPLERRLQTAAVLVWMSIFLVWAPVAVGILVALVFTPYWWLTVIYCTFFYFDRDICNRGGRRIEWVRRWRIWKSMADFFPVTLIKTTDLSPDENYVFGCHPHGLVPVGAFACFATEARNVSEVFPGIRPTLLTLEGNFLIPGFREIFLCASAASVSEGSINHLLGRRGAKGEAVAVVVGGVAEQACALRRSGDNIKLILKRRRGFVKMALRHGASLVPVFSFGETELFKQIDVPGGSWLCWLRDAVRKRFGRDLLLFRGRGIFQYSFGLLPFRKPVTVVVGEPIPVDKKDDFTEEEVDALHETYANALVDLFESNKKKYSPQWEVNLEIL